MNYLTESRDMEGSWEQSCNTSIRYYNIEYDYLRESRNMEGSWEQSCNTSIRYYNIEYDIIKEYGRQLGAVI